MVETFMVTIINLGGMLWLDRAEEYKSMQECLEAAQHEPMLIEANYRSKGMEVKATVNCQTMSPYTLWRGGDGKDVFVLSNMN